MTSRSGEADYERLEPGEGPTPTHVLKFDDGTRVSAFIDDSGELAITIDGPTEPWADLKSRCYVTVDGMDVVYYMPGEGWQ